MKKPSSSFNALALGLASLFLLTSCSVFGKLSDIDYNNQVVDGINATSTVIENTATLYNEKIPNKVSEKDTLDLTTMQSAYDDATQNLENASDLATLESRNIEQQNAVRTGLSTYKSAADLYIESYKTMLDYYSNGDYQKDISKVGSIDEALHTNYTTFIQANNDLVDTLDSFVTKPLP